MDLIEKEIHESKSGVKTLIFKTDKCRLKFSAFDGDWQTGQIEHLQEIVYAPSGMVCRDKDSNWELALMMPTMYISTREIPRLQQAINDMMNFWKDVKPLLT